MSTVLEAKLGEIRPTQLIYSYGIGQVVDLPQLSGIIMGLDDWPEGYTVPLEEERLLAEVRRHLGAQVDKLVGPPPQANEPAAHAFAKGAAALVGVPIAPFPRYLRCSFCRVLAPISSGLFRLQTTPGRPDLARYVHSNCNRANQPRVLPARFLFACDSGHLDDFPWHYFAHGGADSCDGMLQLDERGHTGEAADIHVRCRKCSKGRSMALAFGDESVKFLPRCTGRRPHLRDYEEGACLRPTKTIALGASNLWFASTKTALHVPASAKTQLNRLVEANWATVLAPVKNAAVLTYLRDQGKLGDFGTYTDEQIWTAIESRRQSAETAEHPDLKTPEWLALTMHEGAREPTIDFELKQTAEPTQYRRQIRRVVLAKRLRAVTALIGFSRISEQPDLTGERSRPSLSRQPPRFVPASEVRGEGIFLEFQEAEVERWVDKQKDKDARLLEAHKAYRRARGIEPDGAGYPGIKFVLLHTFAHALMRQLALECGYAAASVRERIYANDSPDIGPVMAGILLYTAAPDSEGTLGGLVRMGEQTPLSRLIRKALEEARLCSADPLCAEHQPDERNLHGAVCHGCGFSPETSCEAGNRYLDRTTLVSTVATKDGFFE